MFSALLQLFCPWFLYIYTVRIKCLPVFLACHILGAWTWINLASFNISRNQYLHKLNHKPLRLIILFFFRKLSSPKKGLLEILMLTFLNGNLLRAYLLKSIWQQLLEVYTYRNNCGDKREDVISALQGFVMQEYIQPACSTVTYFRF